jgi:tryptophan halogenase
MSKKIEKIVIVGGGSAGWMTASTFIKFLKNIEIVLIESPTIEKIGVGESTLQSLIPWLYSLEIDHKDFMSYTDASYKLSIKFTDFNRIGDGGFHYPFGNPYLGNCYVQNGNDWHILKHYYPETKRQNYVESLYPSSVLLESNKIYFPKNNELENFDMKKDYALQFDAIKFAEWLSEKYAKPRGVVHIQKNVKDVIVNDEGIKKIILEDNENIEADIYVDCTGFNGLLISKALHTEFESFESKLPVNRAWAVQIPYENPEEEVVLYTECTALGYGWVWNAPLYSRIGTGYVYSDKFTTPENALEEFKSFLKKEKGEKRIDDSLKFRDIRFRSGIMSKPWNKNVIGIGLSTAFLEPLESNGLLFIHENALQAVRMLSRGYFTKWDEETYNYAVKKHFYGFASFVQQHYILSSRNDTEFWKYMTTRDVVDSELKLTNMNVWADEMRRKTHDQAYYLDPASGFHCIAVGHEWSPIAPFSIKYWEMYYNSDYLLQVNSFKEKTNKSIKKWKNVIKDAPIHYNYLKKEFHNENI